MDKFKCPIALRSLFSVKAIVVLLSVIIAVEGALLLTPSSSPPSNQPDKVLLAKHVTQLSVTVMTPKGTGTGVLITRDAKQGKKMHFVLTAAHVVANVRTFVPSLEAGKPVTKAVFGEVRVSVTIRQEGHVIRTMVYPARVIQYSNADTGRDLAVLQLPDAGLPDIDTAFDTQVPTVGEDLFHVGSMFGLTESFTCGVVSQVGRELYGRLFDQVSMTIYPGSSGGGVFNADGKCIGIAVLLRAPGLGFIVPAREVMAWSAKAGCGWVTDPTVRIDREKLDSLPVENDGSALPEGKEESEDAPGGRPECR